MQTTHFRARRITLLLAVLGLVSTLGVAPPAQAQTAARTLTVTQQVQLAVAPARAWSAIENFMTWPSWHPAFAGTELVKGDGHSAGSVRRIVTKDGAQFTEELIAHDAATRRVEYRILASPAPVLDYRSTLSVRPSRNGSTVVWSSHFKVKPGVSEAEVKKMIEGIYRAGLDNLATAFDDGVKS